MIRAIVLSTSLLSVMSNSLYGQRLDMIRQQFHEADNENSFITIVDINLENSEDFSGNTVQAYQAVCKTVLAQYVFSPLAKYKYFVEGTKLLEQSIAMNRNVENVYLRLLVQLSAPKLLNYHADIGEDINFIKSNLTSSHLAREDQIMFISNLIEICKNYDHLEQLKSISIY